MNKSQPWKAWTELRTSFVPAKVWRQMKKRDLLSSLQGVIGQLRERKLNRDERLLLLSEAMRLLEILMDYF